MIVICRDNKDYERLLKIGEKYFVTEVFCQDNQIWYKLEGFSNIFNYFRFYPIDLIRQQKIEELGI
jgi:hypothetical protein